MDLGRKLARLPELRARIEARIARDRNVPRPAIAPMPVGPAPIDDREPAEASEEFLEPDHCHGKVAVAAARKVDLGAFAWLLRDPSLERADLSCALFVDTETTGLFAGTGTIAFLIGSGSFDDRSFKVSQLFLKQPGSERPMLEAVAERISSASLLVSYNGKAFDLPLLVTRFVLNRVPVPPMPPHLDLLHAARKVYKRRLERVRLVNVEEKVLGMRRERDVEGHEIPSIYWSYVRSGVPSAELRTILEHNHNDVVALAALLAELGAQLEGVRPKDDPADHLSIALAAFAAKDGDRARAFGEAAAGGGGSAEVTAEALSLLARLDLRARDFARARARLETALSLEPPDAARLHLRLAMLLEHKLKDQARAAEHARLGLAAEPWARHQRRMERIERKIRARQDSEGSR